MTKIQWTNQTWNPVVGCSIVSSGCRECYAMRLAGGRLRNTEAYRGLTEPSKAGPVWNGKVRLLEDRLDQPLRWRKPRRIFVNSMGDLFHENIPDGYIDRVFAVMALAPRHQFQILTKRAERMREYMTAERCDQINAEAGTLAHWDDMPTASWPLPNVWLGVSVEDQKRADERIPHLLRTPAAVRWISAEPLLAPVDFTPWLEDKEPTAAQAYGPRGMHYIRHGAPWLDWVVIGGESGPKARPFDLQWGRDLIQQCEAAGVPVFMKQLGARPMTDSAQGLRFWPKDKKGADMSEWPADLRVREYPAC